MSEIRRKAEGGRRKVEEGGRRKAEGEPEDESGYTIVNKYITGYSKYLTVRNFSHLPWERGLRGKGDTGQD